MAPASVSASGSSSSSVSNDFKSIGAECGYVQSPGSVAVPTSNGQPLVSTWLNNCLAAGILQPAGARLCLDRACHPHRHARVKPFCCLPFMTWPASSPVASTGI